MRKFALITNLDQPDSRPVRVQLCDSFRTRLRGLMFQRALHPGEGVLLIQERDSKIDASIHMLFMRFDLAVVWINSSLEVVDVQHARPWRIAYIPSKPARYVLETALEDLNCFKIGDRVAIDEEPAQ